MLKRIWRHIPLLILGISTSLRAYAADVLPHSNAILDDAEVAYLTSSADRDFLEVYFHINRIVLEADYHDNAVRIDSFADRLRSRLERGESRAFYLIIHSGASPEGGNVYNHWLSEGRGRAIYEQLQQRLGAQMPEVRFTYEGARWREFERKIAADSTIKWRTEMLRVLRDSTLIRQPAWNGWMDPRERALRDMHGGFPWLYILKHLMPDMRSSQVYVVTPVRLSSASGPEPLSLAEPPLPLPDLPPLPWPDTDDVPVDYPVWAIKTNLLLDAVLAPNLAVEVPLGRRNRWSAEVEHIHPWWLFRSNSKAEQIWTWALELRLWLGNRRRHRWLDGHHIGLAAMTGKYDFEWKEVDDPTSVPGYRGEGYQGEPIVLYANYGWQHRFSRHWAVDLGFGVGFMGTKYRHYIADKDNIHLIWHDSGRFRWFGPVKANLSLVYTVPMKRHADWVTRLRQEP